VLFQDIIKHKGESEKIDREFNAELLCKLLTTIGKILDLPRAKGYMDTYFNFIVGYVSDIQNFSSRIRFMFQDLIDLRATYWVPRRQENEPKTFSELASEAAVKELEEEYGLSQPISPRTTQASTIASTADTKSQNKPKPSKKKTKSKPKADDQLTIAEPVFISSEKEYIEKLTPILHEFLISEDVHETVSSIRELEAPEYRRKVVELGISLTLEKGNRDREIMSKLLTTLSTEGILKEDHFVKGFKPVVDSIKDLQVDIPFVAKYVEQFITSAVSSHCASRTALNFPGLTPV